MATIIGRKACPDCGFEHAHIKQTPGKLPYRHCPECGLMTHAKNGAQAQLIKAGMRPVGEPEPAPAPKPATDTPPAPVSPPAPPVVQGAAPPASPARRRTWASTLLD